MKNFSIVFLTLAVVAITGCQTEEVTKQSSKLTTQTQINQQKIEGQESTTNKPVYKVVLDSNHTPFEFKNETGNIVGYDVELIQAIADEEGFSIEMIPKNFGELLPAIESEKFDIAISAMKLNESRQDKFLASEPYFQTHEGFLVKQGSPITSVKDIEGHKISVLENSHQHEQLARKENTTVVTEPTIFLAFQSIMTGKTDAVYIEEPILHFEANDFPLNPVRFIASSSETNKYVIFSHKKNQELMTKINHGLQKIKKNGKYHQLTQKWFGDYSTKVEIL